MSINTHISHFRHLFCLVDLFHDEYEVFKCPTTILWLFIYRLMSVAVLTDILFNFYFG